ncbi:hypothetical protein HYALB_00007514 [Hymenoscyphus albidus]|uniref:Uncharacterized protein n=1 Tax=Hymenoscyphus albidus TaxID=595503 RepID=A0A9N9LZ52_9HELO|nr:hypothetical protein HYALB_00007514 [Hymenoscyphus albidus]
MDGLQSSEERSESSRSFLSSVDENPIQEDGEALLDTEARKFLISGPLQQSDSKYTLAAVYNNKVKAYRGGVGI